MYWGPTGAHTSELGCPVFILNVVCCETSIRLETGGKAEGWHALKT
jgi:hypothetical protein